MIVSERPLNKSQESRDKYWKDVGSGGFFADKYHKKWIDRHPATEPNIR